MEWWDDHKQVQASLSGTLINQNGHFLSVGEKGRNPEWVVIYLFLSIFYPSVIESVKPEVHSFLCGNVHNTPQKCLQCKKSTSIQWKLYTDFVIYFDNCRLDTRTQSPILVLRNIQCSVLIIKNVSVSSLEVRSIVIVKIWQNYEISDRYYFCWIIFIYLSQSIWRITGTDWPPAMSFLC